MKVKRRKREGRKFREGQVLPDENDDAAASVCDISRKIPDWEWLRSDRRVENPWIRKEENELRLDSWIQKVQPDKTR